MTREGITRRVALRGIVGTGGLILAGCDQLSDNQTFQRMLESAEKLNLGGQRLVLNSSTPLAREYQKSDISRVFKANGTIRPDGDEYKRMAMEGFQNWKLQIGGLVNKPVSYSLEELRAMPSRTQITRHDCVEGWSAIGQWTGVPLSFLLKQAEMKQNAKYLVFRCADDLIGSRDGSGLYYESIDMVDAFHPQTIMAYAMNGQTLPIEHGAPLRLRVERQLGYKMAKYVMRIEAVENFSKIALGKGGFWEDRGYEWYAGI
ncbi:MAG TPA: molybdopterin-binding protein [Micropepsaceae bacterium]|jgi:DMSO/TMAO reductase YedYZ molybdopterin-dependent catalytic subunit|nr:molybdopterin-binding protein [Micropepsaceae bacterium]